MIPKSELIEMFESIAQQTDWDMNEEMLWCYFFSDDDPEKLEACSDRLIEDGYHFVDLSEGDESDDPWTLQVAKIEVHTPDTLDLRNQQLEAIAKEMGLSAYEGMDVGPIDSDDDFDEEDDEDQ
jgi:hypothetical protein